MKPPVSVLNAAQRHTRELLLCGSPDATLEWRAVRSLLDAIADCHWAANGDYKAMLDGRELILRPAASKDVPPGDARTEIRLFVEQWEHAQLAAEAKSAE
ncbi:hypothetical protein [Horticoccus sp. 23ND18S-11]|uniref:hypothetical protein n=1 Tax=Horticoccus sp. 23ND18S-11 TaxID=3391832 RepID=UPI0039C9C165